MARRRQSTVVFDAAWVASIIFGGACGAVAGALVKDAVRLVPEIAAATGLPVCTVEYVIEILVRHSLATRDGCGVRPATVSLAHCRLLHAYVKSKNK